MRSTLHELVESKRIDDAIGRRALDVLFTTVERSVNDEALAEIFRRLVLSEGEQREELLGRLSNDIVRALDPVLAKPRWTVAPVERASRIHHDLARLAPGLDAELRRLHDELGYPLEVRDVDTGIVFRLIPGGYLPRPDGRVEFVDPFYIAKSEVAEHDWFRFKGGKVASNRPVEGRTWIDIENFVADADLSLPTEAEWEFAARSGIPTPFWMGGMLPPPGTVHHRVEKAEGVGANDGNGYRGNYFSLRHVHGNVAEWCAHPLGRLGGTRQPARGGGYNDLADACTASSVKMLPIGSKGEANAVGFRPIRRIQPGVTSIAQTGDTPLRVVVVEPDGPLDDHWKVKILREVPDPLLDGLDPEYCKRVAETKLPWEVVDGMTNLRMRLVPPGEFTVWASKADDFSFRVLIAHPFYLGVTEVSPADWGALLPIPEGSESGRLPIDNMSWSECRQFLRAANTGLRFPNEFEWHFACNLGRNQPFAWIGLERVRSHRAYCNAGGGPLLASDAMYESPFGFRGMHGNAREWCLNPGDLDGLIVDPEDRLTLVGARFKSTRGGRVADGMQECRADHRLILDMDAGRAGFRIARSVPTGRELMVTEWPVDARRQVDDVERPRPSDQKRSAGGRGKNAGDPANKEDPPQSVPVRGTEEDQERPPGGGAGGDNGGRGVGTFGAKGSGGSNGNGNGDGNTPPGDPGDGDMPDVPDAPEGPIETGARGG